MQPLLDIFSQDIRVTAVTGGTEMNSETQDLATLFAVLLASTSLEPQPQSPEFAVGTTENTYVNAELSDEQRTPLMNAGGKVLPSAEQGTTAAHFARVPAVTVNPANIIAAVGQGTALEQPKTSLLVASDTPKVSSVTSAPQPTNGLTNLIPTNFPANFAVKPSTPLGVPLPTIEGQSEDDSISEPVRVVSTTENIKGKPPILARGSGSFVAGDRIVALETKATSETETSQNPPHSQRSVIGQNGSVSYNVPRSGTAIVGREWTLQELFPGLRIADVTSRVVKASEPGAVAPTALLVAESNPLLRSARRSAHITQSNAALSQREATGGVIVPQVQGAPSALSERPIAEQPTSNEGDAVRTVLAALRQDQRQLDQRQLDQQAAHLPRQQELPRGVSSLSSNIKIAAQTVEHLSAPERATASDPQPSELERFRVEIGRKEIQTLLKRGEIRVSLHPQHLGTMKIQVIKEAGTLRAQMEVANSEVRRRVEEHLPVLRESFERAGLRVEQIHISDRHELFDYEREHLSKQRHAEAQTQRSQNRRASSTDAELESHKSPAPLKAMAGLNILA